MKTRIFFFLLIASKFSCKPEDANNSEVGQWRLSQVLADPGDGSGVFQAVTSSKVLDFQGNGTVSVNGNVCDLNIAIGNSMSGTYSTADSTITFPDCANPNFPIRYEIDGNEMTLIYQCFEACRVKYVRL